MKISQSVIILFFKESEKSYLFGSLAAIYSLFSAGEIGISYASLRNAVSQYIKDNKINENVLNAQVIYNNKNSKIIVQRAPLLLTKRSL